MEAIFNILGQNNENKKDIQAYIHKTLMKEIKEE